MTGAEVVWVVDDDESIRWVLGRALEHAGMQVRLFERVEPLLVALELGMPDVVMTDIRMPEDDGLTLLAKLSEAYPGLPVIVMTAYADLDNAVSAYQGGAFEFLAKPFDIDEAVGLVRRAVADRADPDAAGQFDATPSTEILGSAPAMQDLFRAIGRLSQSNMTVLITGESGTGKELVARALHANGPRRHAPFIALNTAAIPADLLESELFGHERGAFTGAQSLRRGRFEQAHGGTLLLDEIGDMPAHLQTRLLRVLADGEFYRVGGHTPLRVDVRIIAATHQPLASKVADGLFREDLYHRLNVIRVVVPPLRERPEDVPALARHFLSSAAAELDTGVKLLSATAAKHLCGLDWPGNVRQLENTCRWLTVMASGTEIEVDDLPDDLRDGSGAPDGPDWRSVLGQWADRRLALGTEDLLSESLPDFERTLIEAALKKAGGRRQLAARLLGWGRNTLTRKMRSLALEK